MKIPEYSPCVLIIVVAIVLVLVFGKFNIAMLFAALGAFTVTFAFTDSLMFATISGVVALVGIAFFMRNKDGFNTNTPPTDISNTISFIKEKKQGNEGFISQVYENIKMSGYGSPGFGMAGPLVEGFEDEEKAKKVGKPGNTEKAKEEEGPPTKNVEIKVPEKQEIPGQFKLGEIPSQVKNGPHIDAGSTLIKAIQGLNPDQINAMSKDTQQLIETQKSLMGMLGTMKPMMQDGKELMDTFQQMFGQ
jgi:hypothetical protein